MDGEWGGWASGGALEVTWRTRVKQSNRPRAMPLNSVAETQSGRSGGQRPKKSFISHTVFSFQAPVLEVWGGLTSRQLSVVSCQLFLVVRGPLPVGSRYLGSLTTDTGPLTTDTSHLLLACARSGRIRARRDWSSCWISGGALRRSRRAESRALRASDAWTRSPLSSR